MAILIIRFLGKGNILIKVTLLYLAILSSIALFLDFDLWGWKLALVFIGWFLVISQYLHIRNKNTRSTMQNEVQGVLEKDDFNFVDYKESVTLKVEDRTCDVLVAINDNKLMIKLKDKWFISISRIKGLHRKEIGGIKFLCFQVRGENSAKIIDFCIEDSRELASLSRNL